MEAELKSFQRGATVATGLGTVLMAKNVAVFRPCLTNFPEAKLKSNEIILLVEISWQLKIDWLCHKVISNHSYASLQWKNSKGYKKKYKIYSLQRKRSPGNLVLVPRLVLREKYQDEAWLALSGQDPTQPSTQLVKTKKSKESLLPKTNNNNNKKTSANVNHWDKVPFQAGSQA